MRPQKCPRCGLINPGTAQQCDCGYNFNKRDLQNEERKKNRDQLLDEKAIEGSKPMEKKFLTKRSLTIAMLVALAAILLFPPYRFQGGPVWSFQFTTHYSSEFIDLVTLSLEIVLLAIVGAIGFLLLPDRKGSD